MSVLVVAAHPDDEVLGAGGAIAGSGDPVDIAILGEGITSRHANPSFLTFLSLAMKSLRPTGEPCSFMTSSARSISFVGLAARMTMPMLDCAAG